VVQLTEEVEEGEGLSGGVVAGIIIAVIIVLLIIAVGVYFKVFRKSSKDGISKS